ncbi:asparaginase [Leifsonia shinshuensis]|uniref:asparaginase n=1 Tax=Leifsonia shinshuensis TaxID=150026 RepID=A0A7G6Y815_9MICO|nr:asparaginase [Leifsonia shinshuensis]QNE34630.1 asparaginase [Leifsonia shinshuensis]
MPHIVVLATGGTISSRSGAGGSVATDGGPALVAGVEVAGVTVESVDVLRKNSFNLTLRDLRELSEAIAGQLGRAEVDGIVVTHGTDTLEESAFLADAVHSDERPVVFTGSQRPADHPASDGPGNLADAIALAADPAARGRGVLVCFAGMVFAARGVHKAETLAPAPFAAHDSGAVGLVAGGRAMFAASPVRPAALPRPGRGFDDIRVDAVVCHPGGDRTLFDAAVAAGARGIVLIGTGSGNASAALIDAIQAATRAGVVVALSTRVPRGPVVPLYGGGGGVDAVGAGALPAVTLPASQARILLALLLDTEPADRVAHRFAAFAGPAHGTSITDRKKEDTP